MKTEVLKQETDMPAFLKNMQGSRGSEDVSTDDLVFPRLELCQALSPCLNKKDPSYIKGIEKGMLYNNVTREIYGQSVIVCPVKFKKEWLLWGDRKSKMAGFYGAFSSLPLALAEIEKLDQPEFVQAVKTHQQMCLLVKENNKIEEIAISMAKSKRKPSETWNSLIRINGGDRFSRLYVVSSVEENNDGEYYENLKVTNFGFVTETVFEAALELYEAIKEGSATVDRGQEEDTSELAPLDSPEY